MREPLCPQCQHTFVQRVHRRWVMERVLSLVYIYPFCCQLCGHRFRAQQWGVRYVRQPVDRRQYERMAVSFPVTFSGMGGDGEGVVLEVSLGGCGLRTAVIFPEGMLLQMQLHVAPSEPAITVDTAVVRSVRGGFVGLEFLQIAPHARARLSQLMYNLLAARRGTARSQEVLS